MTWDRWVNGVLGLWLIVSAFLNLTETYMAANLVISGFLVAVVSFLSMTTGHALESHGAHA